MIGEEHEISPVAAPEVESVRAASISFKGFRPTSSKALNGLSPTFKPAMPQHGFTSLLPKATAFLAIKAIKGFEQRHVPHSAHDGSFQFCCHDLPVGERAVVAPPRAALENLASRLFKALFSMPSKAS